MGEWMYRVDMWHQKLFENQLKACRGQIDKSEVKLEVSSIYGIFRCNSMQNNRLLS